MVSLLVIVEEVGYEQALDSLWITNAPFLDQLPSHTHCSICFAGGKGNSVVLTTPASLYQASQSSQHKENKDNQISTTPVTSSMITSVQIRWLDGTLVVATMFATDVIGDIRQLLLEYSGSGPVDGFELRAAYPPRILDDTLTMTEAGLVPNGTIHARKM